MQKHTQWTIEILELYKEKKIEKLRQKLFQLTDVLIFLNEFLAEKKVNLLEKDIYSEQLVIKFHMQNLSLIELSKGHCLSSKFYHNFSKNIRFLDISSIITIVRSQYESLLMYQHLYINTEDELQQKLRFDAWIMSSMLSRINLFKDTLAGEPERYTREQNSLNALIERIKGNPQFDTLSERQQRHLLSKGSGKLFKSWEQLFIESKFNKEGLFSKFYYIASAYAHSEGLIALQLKETKHLMNDEQMNEMSYMMLQYSYLMTNIMIMNIVKKFPMVQNRFSTLEEKVQFEVNFNYKLSFK